jgi:ketosteroid isomerase-like protein
MTDELADLTARVTESTSAYINGEIRRYLELVQPAAEQTLMPPYGGPPVHGFDPSDEAVRATSEFFHGGEAELDIAATHASGDLAVIVAVERQHGDVGDWPHQDWSLRVTLVFRREGTVWRQVHRHADPLVRDIGFPLMAAIARGEVPEV